MSDRSRFAFYLVPPYKIARDITEIHALLEKQFGYSAAGRFQAHCTIKGFFKKNERSVETLISSLDKFLLTQPPFEVEFNGFRAKPTSIVLKLEDIDGQPNQRLLAFREQIVDITRPYIADDCDFIESDLGPPFRGHFTLAFRDIPLEMHPQVLAWLRSAPIPTGKFSADTFHFLEFFSEDWGGAWWETLTWKLHRAWSLDR